MQISVPFLRSLSTNSACLPVTTQCVNCVCSPLTSTSYNLALLSQSITGSLASLPIVTTNLLFIWISSAVIECWNVWTLIFVRRCVEDDLTRSVCSGISLPNPFRFHVLSHNFMFFVLKLSNWLDVILINFTRYDHRKEGNRNIPTYVGKTSSVFSAS